MEKSHPPADHKSPEQALIKPAAGEKGRRPSSFESSSLTLAVGYMLWHL
jgi:hypothetical protein